ncbi:histidine phosphotransferase family protein [Loktanella sp. SALINAS62]|uniref:histidine phosphotransferase family protein n=1 Tax=Loktanella sp. SALINAS62 TaxID=2706124 RepID=UPI001B8B43AA|nr:histidine phosphotransferase [Loktanella sp. SALINAS62]
MADNLAALVASRICHDLISPIGAIGNGVELLAMSGGSGSQEMKLITGSVGSASARIRFFRIAYGSARPDQWLVNADIVSVLADLADGGRITYDWTITGEITRPLAQIALLAAQCMESALPTGGAVAFHQVGDILQITARSDRIAADPIIWGALMADAPPPDCTASQVQFALLVRALKDAHCNLSCQIEPTLIAIRVTAESV